MARKTPKTKIFFASSPFSIPREDEVTTTYGRADGCSDHIFGEHQVDATNRYNRYQQIMEFDDYVFSGLTELGLILSKGFCVDSLDDKASNKRMLQSAQDFADSFDLADMFSDCCTLNGRDGTVPILSTVQGTSIDDISFLPMNYTTLLPAGVEPKTGVSTGTSPKVILKGRVKNVVLREDGKEPIVYPIERVELVRWFHRGYEIDDILGRPTLGLYGRSLIEPVQWKVKYLQNILYCHDRAVNRYGQMKLHFEYTALEKMLTERAIEINDAQKVLDRVKEEVKKLKANEDIVTSGFEVEPIESNYSMSVVDMKESLEKDVTNAIFGTEASSGKGAGTTFASAYMAENRKILVMEAMRHHVKRAFDKLIWKQLELEGYGKKQVRTVGVKLAPLVDSEVATADLLQMVTAGILDPQILLNKIGIDAKSNITADEIKANQKAMLRNNPQNQSKGQPSRGMKNEGS